MFDFLQSPLWNTIFVFVTIAVILYYWKPHPLFDEYGNMRAFGLSENKTCFTFSIVTFSSAMVFYFLFTLISRLSIGGSP
jgi:hypothetical protein